MGVIIMNSIKEMLVEIEEHPYSLEDLMRSPIDDDDYKEWESLRTDDKPLVSDKPKTKKNKSSSLTFTKASDLKLQAPDWLIRDVLQNDETSMFFGEPASGKSLVVLDMAVAVSNGAEWCGHKTKKTTVIYIAGEGKYGLMRRLSAIKQEKKLSIDNIFISDRPAKMMDAEDAKAIGETAKANNGRVWVIIDTLHRNFGDGDENNGTDFGKIISNIDILIRTQGEVTTTIVHHTGHNEKDRARGSTTIKASMDSEYLVEKDEVYNTVSLKTTKMKDAPHPDNKKFSIKVSNLGIKDDEGEEVTSVYLAEEEAIDELKGFGA